MTKMNVFTGKGIAAAGILGILVALGGTAALAAEGNTAVQATSVQGAAVVDAAGAQEIALADAGVAEDKAERLYTEADREDGENVYEVSFNVGAVEYEYLIREADGMILEWELDGRDIGDVVAEQSLQPDSAETAGEETETVQNNDILIGMERAKEIALSDAGVNAADVSITKVKYENDGRSVVYEVEFSQNRQEFEYTIDAYTGEIRKMERD